MDEARRGLEDLLRPVVERLGLLWWGMEFVSGAQRALLRIYIDHPERAITLSDCEEVSRALSTPLDSSSLLPERANLEVSSPGLDRMLFEPSQYGRYVGTELQVTTQVPVRGRKRFRGVLRQVEATSFVLAVDGVDYVIEYSAVQKARLVPRY